MWSFLGLSAPPGALSRSALPSSPPPVPVPNGDDGSVVVDASMMSLSGDRGAGGSGGFRVSLPTHDGGSASCLIGTATTATHRRGASNGGMDNMEASTSTSTTTTSASPSSQQQQQPGVAASSSSLLLPPLAPSSSNSAPPSCSIPDSGHSTPQRGGGLGVGIGAGGSNSSSTCSMRPSASPSVSAKLSSAALSLLAATTATGAAKTPSSKERSGGGSGAGAAAAGGAGAGAAATAAGGKGSSPLLLLLPIVCSSAPSGGSGNAPASSSCLGPRRRATLAKLVLALLALAALVNSLSCGALVCRSKSEKAYHGSDTALASLRAIYGLRGIKTPGSWGAVLSGAWPGKNGAGDESSAVVAPATAAATSSSSSASSSSSSASSSQPAADLLIPRIIHQTYRSEAELPPAAARLMLTWRALNPNWEVRFWDDAACLSFVETEFPQWAPAYRALPKDVERSDFFRYLVVLRLGGVYADVDTECRAPLDSLLTPADTLVVGWENEFPTAARAAARKYVRKRQVLQWVFAGAPGHPALRAACEHVARNAWSTMSRAGNLDTLERTGPGAFTDAALAAAEAHKPAGARGDPWGVRVLPKVAFGAHPRGLDGVDPRDPRVAVLHHYLGTWKRVGGWAPGGGLLGAAVAALLPGALAPKGAAAAGAGAGVGSPKKSAKGSSSSSSSSSSVVASRANAAAENAASGRSSEEEEKKDSEEDSSPLMEAALPFDSAAPDRLFPVSLLGTSSPPVTALVPLVGHSERVSGEDVAAALTVYGAWQPGGAPARVLLRRAAAAAAAAAGVSASSSSSSASSSTSSSSSSSPFGDEPTPIEALLGGLDAATLASKRAAEAEESKRRRRSEEKKKEQQQQQEEGEDKKDGDDDASSTSASSASSSSQSSSSSSKESTSNNARDHRAILLDLGAGLGAASLAAAARGHRVVAAEAGPRNAAALRASVAYNGFEDLVEVHEVAVGSGSSGSSGGGKNNGSSSSSSGGDNIVIPSLACLHEKATTAATATALPGSSSSRRLFTDAARGYGARPPPKVAASCARTARRVHAASLVPPAGSGARVGAVRVSAPGWEDLVLDGLLRRLFHASSSSSSSSLPAVLLIELDVAALNAAAASASAATPPSARARKLGPAEDEEEEGEEQHGEESEDEDSLYFFADDDESGGAKTTTTKPKPKPKPTTKTPAAFPTLVGSDAPTLLAKLRSLGYVHVSHSGAACGARWRALARSLGLPPPPGSSSSASASAAAAAAEAAAARANASSAAPFGSGASAASLSSSTKKEQQQQQRGRGSLPPEALSPPVWCRLPPSEVAAFERAAVGAKTAETVLLIHASAVEEEEDPEFEEEEEEVEAVGEQGV